MFQNHSLSSVAASAMASKSYFENAISLSVMPYVRASQEMRHINFFLGAQPKGSSRSKNTTDSKFTIRSKFATAIVKHYALRN